MKKLLTDEQYTQYLSEGAIVLQPHSLGADFHDRLYEHGQNIYSLVESSKSKTAHLDIIGDSLRGRIPEIDNIFKDPNVAGALESILGENYVIHPHNFVHKSSLIDQGFHQDGNLPWNERGHYRSHRPDWALLFYYPQDVTIENGATELILGTQYWTKDFEKDDGTWYSQDSIDRSFGREDMSNEDLAYRDRRLSESVESLGVPDLERKYFVVPKGTVIICNYDILHRGSRSLPGEADRFMYKFHFMRTQEPKASAWSHQQDLNLETVREDIRPIVRHIWNWSANKGGTEEFLDNLEELQYMLFSGDERDKVRSAYLLGEMKSDIAAEVLINALSDEKESVRRAACYGLRVCSPLRVGDLLGLVSDPREGVRRLAVYALGTIQNACNPQVVAGLLNSCIEDSDDLVRSNAVYSLGQLFRHQEVDFELPITALIERLRPGVEPNNTDVALFPRSTVRQSIAYALLQAASNQQFTSEQIDLLLEIMSGDEDRYVQGLIIEIARQSNNLSNGAVSTLLSALSRLRLSPRPLELKRAS